MLLAAQMRDEYSAIQGFKPREAAGAVRGAAPAKPAAPAAAAADSKSHTAKLIDSIPAQRCGLLPLPVLHCRRSATLLWREVMACVLCTPAR